MMNIAIKYCGGCNPTYDRSALVAKIKEVFPDCNFSYYSESDAMDILLLINGCKRACTLKSSYNIQTGSVISIDETKSLDALYSKIHTFLQRIDY